jgi:adenylate cyclase
MPAAVFRFGDFELDRTAYQLRSKGRPLKLERIPLELLFLLAERGGQLVTREEILERIWGKDVFIATDNSINTAIGKIRRVLRDNAEAPRFVVTVPAKGYRLVAALSGANSGKPGLSRGAGDGTARPSQSSLVGRGREMAELSTALDDAAGGRGGLLLVSGEPGIGKTRLCTELAALAQTHEMAVRVGRCRDRDETVPYLPFVEILESCVERTADDPDALRKLLGAEGPELARLMPKLRRVLPDLPAPPELAPEQARRLLFNSFCDFCARLARQRPAVFVVEDLHWADDSTLALLDHLAQRLPEPRWLIIGTFRDAELDVSSALAKTLEDLLRGRLANHIRLKGLPRGEVAEMLAGLSGKSPPAAVVSEIHTETNGNPFFVEELFRHLQEENRLYDSTGQFRTELRIGELEAPRNVRLVVGRRLARLSDPSQKCLASAAIIGRSVTFEVLEAATASQTESLLESVEEAERAGLIFSNADVPKQRFEFSHELTRQAVLSGQSSARRRQLHLEVARAIKQVHAGALDDHCAELGRHYERGGDARQAVEYLGRAGQRAAQQSAYSEALGYLKRALELLKSLPDTEERGRQEFDLLMALSSSLNILKPVDPELEPVLVRARELCEQLGEGEEQMESLLQLGLFRLQRREYDVARELTQKVLGLAERAQVTAMVAGAHNVLGAISHFLGEMEAARKHLELAVALFSPGPFRSFGEAHNVASATGILTTILLLLGYPVAALRKGREFLDAIRRLSDPVALAVALFWEATNYVYLRDSRTALERAEELLVIATDQEMRFYAAHAAFYRGWVLAAKGREQEGLAEMSRALPAIEGSPGTSWFYACLGDSYRKIGRPEEGLTTMAATFRETEQGGERTVETEHYRVKGELLLMCDPPEEAEAEHCFRTAIDIARRQKARLRELRATTSLARLLKRQGKADEARAMLSAIYNWFTEGFEFADLKDAKALLDELSE